MGKIEGIGTEGYSFDSVLGVYFKCRFMNQADITGFLKFKIQRIKRGQIILAKFAR